MWPAIVSFVVAAGVDVWFTNADVGPGETKSFQTHHVEAGGRYALVTRGHCEVVSHGSARLRRWREKINPNKAPPFGVEYRVYVGELEFAVGIDEQTVEFRANGANPVVRVEDRSGPVTSMKCKLTSVAIRSP